MPTSSLKSVSVSDALYGTMMRSTDIDTGRNHGQRRQTHAARQDLQGIVRQEPAAQGAEEEDAGRQVIEGCAGA